MSIRPPHRSNNRSVPPAYGLSRCIGHRPSTRYKVLLHNTADKELMFVVRVVQELTRFGTAEAEFRMWEAHYRGRSLVLVTHLERAELFVEQFADRGLCIDRAGVKVVSFQLSVISQSARSGATSLSDRLTTEN